MTSMTVNGEAVHYRLDPQTPLLWALRDASNLTGAKYGCDSKDCGACTVIIDGRAVTSCSVTLASLEGADITTIEGLSADRAHPVQQAWAEEQVSQCGMCEPGFIMAIAALLKAMPAPDAAAVRAIPNICRCGAYPRIRRAIDRAAKQSALAAEGPLPERKAASRLNVNSSEKAHVPSTNRP
jgi:isoquinoline 1-oxidoreductase alpha subunit